MIEGLQAVLPDLRLNLVQIDRPAFSTARGTARGPGFKAPIYQPPQVRESAQKKNRDEYLLNHGLKLTLFPFRKVRLKVILIVPAHPICRVIMSGFAQARAHPVHLTDGLSTCLGYRIFIFELETGFPNPSILAVGHGTIFIVRGYSATQLLCSKTTSRQPLEISFGRRPARSSTFPVLL